MNQRANNSGDVSGGLIWNQLSKWIVPLGRIIRVCENAACKQRSVLWPVWLRSAEGMRLQGRWYCSPHCFELAALHGFLRLLATPDGSLRKPHRIPIGLILLSRGVINSEQLKQALALQRAEGKGRLGKFLQQIEAVTDQDIAVGLAAQWGCPLYPLHSARDFLQCASLLPLTLLETGRMLPVHYARYQETLHLAFVEGVDRTALYAVEQMLHLKTIPCIVSESALAEALEELRHVIDVPTTVFDGPIEPREMARRRGAMHGNWAPETYRWCDRAASFGFVYRPRKTLKIFCFRHLRKFNNGAPTFFPRFRLG